MKGEILKELRTTSPQFKIYWFL